MKQLKCLMAVVVLVLICCTLSSCSNDDEAGGNTSIVGTWQMFIPDEDSDNGGYTLEMTFKKNGEWIHRNYGTVDGQTIDEKFVGTWKIEGDYLLITLDGATQQIEYKIVDNTLFWYIYEDGHLEGMLALTRQ